MKTFYMKVAVFVCSILPCSQTANDWTPPEFCHDYACPEYDLVGKNEKFEERFYHTSNWLRTKITGTSTGNLISGYYTLSNYVRDVDPSFSHTVPVAVTMNSTSGKDVYYVSFFVPPAQNLPISTDSSIEMYTMPAGTMFVRIFGTTGIPTSQNWLSNLEILKKDLNKTECDLNTQFALSYDGMKFFGRHDEVWIPGA